jgi:hypothetical protein
MEPPPPEAACHVAAELLVAVGTYPVEGVPVTVMPPISVELFAVQAVHVPVRLVMTPLAGVPSAGVTRAGLVASTGAPDPVTALARPVATPVPRPVIPLKGTAAAVIEVLHPKPVFVVQMSASPAALHPLTA